MGQAPRVLDYGRDPQHHAIGRGVVDPEVVLPNVLLYAVAAAGLLLILCCVLFLATCGLWD